MKLKKLKLTSDKDNKFAFENGWILNTEVTLIVSNPDKPATAILYITIFHEYEGVAKWVNGEWKAKKPETKKYQDAMTDLMKRIEIKFVKVPAHAGVHFNELADRLAKDACNL